MQTKKFTVSSRLLSFRNAWAGLIKVTREELNFKIHLCVTIIDIIAGFVLQINTLEWIAIILCIGLVLSMEAMNTAVEHIANYLTSETDSRIKSIKDISAAAVLITSIISVIIGVIIFLPKIILLIQHLK